MSNLVGIYSSRRGLAPGSPVFVGRDETLRDIFMRLGGDNSLPGIAVVGPHRIGKTTLLKQLLASSVRSRYLEQPDGWQVAYLDVSQRHWTDFGSLRAAAFTSLGIPAEDQAAHPDSSFTDAIRRISRERGSRTTVLILDEFNYIAADLGKDEQAELREQLKPSVAFH